MNNSAYMTMLDTVKSLRDPKSGCPWDLKQTVNSMGTSLFEECCECLDGIANKDHNNIKEELGDVIYTATIMSYILEQDGVTTVEEILTAVTNKMVTRHPHVFNKKDSSATTSDEVLIQWEEIKETKEGRVKKGLLDKIPNCMPPLEKANQIQKKVEKVGFDWPEVDFIFDKIIEETNEVKEEIASGNRDNLELEIGDLLFSVVNLARFLKIDPTISLNRTNNKFTKRFAYIEQEMKLMGKELNSQNFKLMDQLWEKAKTI